jgi:hypothetical protein
MINKKMAKENKPFFKSTALILINKQFFIK